MLKGEFFDRPMAHEAHERMAKLLSCLGEDFPTSAWELAKAMAGPSTKGRTVRQIRHLSERILSSAERHGLVRRLSSRVSTDTEDEIRKTRQYYESLFVLTQKGRKFLDDRDRYLRARSACLTCGAV